MKRRSKELDFEMPQGTPIELRQNSFLFFGDFKQVRKIVYLELDASTDDENPSRPTIEEELRRDYEEVRAFPEFLEGGRLFRQRQARRRRLDRDYEEVRNFPEFQEV